MQMAEGVDGCYCYAKARRNIFLMTMLLLNGNRFIVPKWRLERWMPKWQKKIGYGVCSPTNVAKCNEHVKKNVSDPWLLSVEFAVRITG